MVSSLPEHPLTRKPGWRLTPDGWTTEPEMGAISAHYRIIGQDEALSASRQAWEFRDVAQRQHEAYAELLTDLDRGVVRVDFQIAADALTATGLPALTLLEIGCGSGYYAAVLDRLLPGRITYTGVDYSASMIALARENYGAERFQVGDACALPFPDASFDVAMNGVSLMHIPDYATAIRETRRVAQRFCLFHTTILKATGPTVLMEKSAYGRPALEVIIGEAEFLRLASSTGLRFLQMWDSIPYDLVDEIGEHTYSRSYLFEVCGSLRPEIGSRQASPQVLGTSVRPTRLLNLGCGSHLHPDWVNLDMNSGNPEVISHNLLERLPFVDETFEVVYHSHVIEHLPKDKTPFFLSECHRVLAPGGLIRVVVPDLEQIARLYVDLVGRASTGDAEAALRYDWIVIELLDQIVRQRSGGEMLEYWRQEPMPAAEFVFERVGNEARRAIEHIKAGHLPPREVRQQTPEEIGQFRLSGEIHQWMYDRFSLKRLLIAAGFADPVVVTAAESALADWSGFQLDTMPDGSTRKPDSLFMEARKP